jgi:cytosine/adenosine deaminase-related metal-dependent hydrolase
MTARVKSSLLLVATLLIGMVLGALLNARLAEQRLERIASLRSARGFSAFIERSIEYRDEAQREAVRAILDRAGARMTAHMEETRREVRALFDSTRAELSTVLTEEQLEQLEQRLEMGRQNRRPRGGPRRPPPGAPPR